MNESRCIFCCILKVRRSVGGLLSGRHTCSEVTSKALLRFLRLGSPFSLAVYSRPSSGVSPSFQLSETEFSNTPLWYAARRRIKKQHAPLLKGQNCTCANTVTESSRWSTFLLYITWRHANAIDTCNKDSKWIQRLDSDWMLTVNLLCINQKHQRQRNFKDVERESCQMSTDICLDVDRCVLGCQQTSSKMSTNVFSEFNKCSVNSANIFSDVNKCFLWIQQILSVNSTNVTCPLGCLHISSWASK